MGLGFTRPPHPKRRSERSVESVSGLRLEARPRGSNRVMVRALDRNGKLIFKANFHIDDWKNFCKGVK